MTSPLSAPVLAFIRTHKHMCERFHYGAEGDAQTFDNIVYVKNAFEIRFYNNNIKCQHSALALALTLSVELLQTTTLYTNFSRDD